MSRVTFTPRRFRVAPAATTTDARRARRGSHLRLRLSEPADARIVIERARPGRRVGRRCKASAHRLRKRPRCRRYQRAATLTPRNLPAGPSSLPFSGRIRKRALAASSYRATITATDRAQNRSAPKRARFRIVRR